MTEPGLCKVVALLNGLPDEAATALEAQLSIAERQALSAARARATELPAELRSAAVTDFLLAMAASTAAPSPKQLGIAAAATPHLVSVLADEHPQTIALVLTRLAPAAAAEVLESLPAELRTQVARRIATLESVDEQTIRTVESTLAERLAALPLTQLQVIDGVAALGVIMQSLDPRAEQMLLDGLATEEPLLAQAVACHTFTVEDVLDWSRASAQILLAKVETRPLAIALKHTSSETRRKILELLPAHFAEQLRDAVAHLGNVPATIVEQSRQTIASTLRDLQNAGKITVDPLPPTNRLVA
jgi:flagellar motor switch protein FliG